jgi:UPF0755 protein
MSDLGGTEREPITTEEAISRRVRRTSKGVQRRRRVVGLGGLIIIVVILVAATWYELESHALGPEGQEVVVTVPTGASVSSSAGALSGHGIISSSLAFHLFDLVHGTPSVQPGNYLFHKNLTFGQVHAILSGGPNIYVVDVSRGLMLSEVASQVDGLPGHQNSSFAKVAASGVVYSIYSPFGSKDLEGMLGTGAYLVYPGESDTTLLKQMVTRFEKQAETAGLTTASAQVLGLTPYQVITAASIVEKEGYIYANMPDVARVIYNRLAADMPLQMDSTVLYALGQDGGKVTSQDLALRSPYNSYLNTGLTPTPICSPSPQALAAAVHPPAGGWLYFELVKKDGTEAFADTFAEQLANEKLSQQRGLG